MEKSEINDRIIDAINHVLNSNGNVSKSELARQFGIKPSKFSEILNKRMMAGTDIMSSLVKIYHISPNWLLTGSGSLIEESVRPNHTFALSTDRQIEVQDIPLYDLSATAGIMAIFNDLSVTPEDYLRVPNLPPVDGAIYVRGE